MLSSVQDLLRDPDVGRGFLTRLAIDLAWTSVLVRGIYYHHYRRSHLFLAFFSLNLVIFLITFFMNQVQMSVGAAFGLFAVFSMLRYRTEGISAKDMTYLVLVIALGLLMAIVGGGWHLVALVGAIVVVTALVLESNWLVRREQSHVVHYDNAKLVNAASWPELLADLSTRTGHAVHRVDVEEVDYLRDAARLTVFYRER